jgi:hypothetical protein
MKTSSIHTSQITILAVVLIVASILAPFADAFRSSATATPPIVEPLNFQTEGTRRLPRTQHSNEVTEPDAASRIHIEKVTTVTPRRKTKYDLGLGKNKPVITHTTRAQKTPPTDNEFLEPARFLIEHESVRSYPSPLDSESESQSRTNDQTKGKRKNKNLPRVKHRRHSEDVLLIRDPDSIRNADDCDDCNACHPVIVPIHRFSTGKNGQAEKFDVNTVWVEMMLHNEQKKIFAQ